MTLQVDLWQLVWLLVSFIGFAVGAGKLLLRQVEKRLDGRFAALDAASKEWRRMEREWLEWRADLPLQYVRREDWGRNTITIRDVARGDTITCSGAAFARPAPIGYTEQAGNIEWTFHAGKIQRQLGSGTPEA
jgi:hypothetical protein